MPSFLNSLADPLLYQGWILRASVGGPGGMHRAVPQLNQEKNVMAEPSAAENFCCFYGKKVRIFC